MARYYLRGSKGRWAGSTGGGGKGGSGGGAGLPAGTVRGGILKSSSRTQALAVGGRRGPPAAGAGYQKAGGLGRRGVTGAKIYTRGEVAQVGGRRVAGRRYVAQRRNVHRDAMVFKVRNGRVTNTPVGRGNIMSRGAVSGGTRTRPGSPIGGNKNVRYVSRTTSIMRRRPGSYAAASHRAVGRGLSRHGATRISRGQNVRGGFVVMYGPRQRTG